MPCLAKLTHTPGHPGSRGDTFARPLKGEKVRVRPMGSTGRLSVRPPSIQRCQEGTHMHMGHMRDVGHTCAVCMAHICVLWSRLCHCHTSHMSYVHISYMYPRLAYTYVLWSHMCYTYPMFTSHTPVLCWLAHTLC